MTDLERDLQNALVTAQEQLASAENPKELEQLRIDFLGRKGVIPALMKRMREVAPEDKPAVGKAANSAKDGIANAITEATNRLANSADDGSAIDITLPGRRERRGAKHPLSQVMDESVQIFRRLGFVVADGPELESVRNNFDALNTPADHPSRDIQDTF